MSVAETRTVTENLTVVTTPAVSESLTVITTPTVVETSTVAEIREVVDGDLREQAWTLYSESFDELRYLAVQRHVMYRDEFDAVMADPRVEKFLLWGHDGSLQGLSTHDQPPALDAARLAGVLRPSVAGALRRPGSSTTSASSGCTPTATAPGCSATWCGP